MEAYTNTFFLKIVVVITVRPPYQSDLIFYCCFVIFPDPDLQANGIVLR